MPTKPGTLREHRLRPLPLMHRTQMADAFEIDLPSRIGERGGRWEKLGLPDPVDTLSQTPYRKPNSFNGKRFR